MISLFMNINLYCYIYGIKDINYVCAYITVINLSLLCLNYAYTSFAHGFTRI